MGSYPSIIPESQVRWFLNEILKENLIGFSRFMLRTPYFFSGLEPSPVCRDREPSPVSLSASATLKEFFVEKHLR